MRSGRVHIPCAQPVPPFLCKLHTYYMLLCHCKQSKYLRKCGGRQGGDKGITISHSPREPIVSSNRRTLSARNSARMLDVLARAA